MFSYVFMKILESRPSRYDKGINILTGGHAQKVKQEIVATRIKPGLSLLDVGCGTGELMADAARAGARVTGIDLSEAMLDLARERFESDDLKGKATFHQAGVIELDKLFADHSFDLITSTLVFSELHAQERRWALVEINRILKPSGVLVLADEVIPRTFLKRLIHSLVRLPLAFITYLVAQIGTKAVPNMYRAISQAGFEVFLEKRSLLDSFAIVYARKSDEIEPSSIGADTTLTPDDDVSVLKTIWDFTGRWFPNSVEPGLRKIGHAGPDAPVIVTGNFHLTVRRAAKALVNMDAWLLVAPTRGINVWCASSGGDMTQHSVIAVMRTSRLEEKVLHRRLILPQLSASGVDRKALEDLTGWEVDFGPVYATDIANYIDQNYQKTSDQSLVRYPLSFRLEMLLAMNALVWLIFAIITCFVNIKWMVVGSTLFWSTGFILYAGYSYLPGNSGWLKAGILSIFEVLGIAFFTGAVLQESWWTHWGWMVVVVILTLWLGFDLKGIVGGNISEAESLMHKLGVKSIGSLFSAHPAKIGTVQHQPDACTNCFACISVCPKGVYAISREDNQVALKNPERCFICGACVKQCPNEALSMVEKE